MSANSSTRKIKDWLTAASRRLETAGIGTARLDCLVLLEDATGKDRTHILAHPELVLTGEQLDRLNSWLDARAQHQPLAFIRGKTEFYGREFVINEDVLEPRPESETMIDLLKALPLSSARIADVGAGSGVLGITAKLELPDAAVHLFEIDAAALAVAKQHIKKHQVDVKFSQSDLLEKAATAYDIVLANLPYVPDHYQINEAAMMEPRIAIFGGKDGLDLYRRLFKQLKSEPARYVLTESLPFQHIDLQVIAYQHGYQQTIEDDFIQVFENISTTD